MSIFEDEDDKVNSVAQIWLVILSGAYFAVGLYVLFIQQRYFAGCFTIILSRWVIPKGIKPISLFIARCQVPVAKSIGASAKSAALERERKRKVAEEAARAEQEKLTVARAFIDRRLAMIDDSLRVYEGEGDPTNRTILLQTAQQQIVELSAKKVSGELPAHVLTEEKILAHATATSDHMVRIGLSEDRLHEEMLRLFNNFNIIQAPPTDAEVRTRQAEAFRGKLQSQAESLKPHMKSATDKVRDMAATMGTTSVQSVIVRLAEVDKCLRLLETEQDPSRRGVVIEKAHSEIMALEVSKAVGKLALDVLTNPVVADHARATKEHLARLGMGDDRLSHDIHRLFNGIEQPQG